ncbi:hypothetical protein BRADI_2g37521v3 [Brachypodium distachyon]|uniref:Uncharacterized protein n=1 Tax=Brachypodium distachyon TaxID=15368 RepID=A0A0Q3G8T1_BRADI|nr:hypothetical protein BRADI_2g37521v3 [Brachypodium distachyon]
MSISGCGEAADCEQGGGGGSEGGRRRLEGRRRQQLGSSAGCVQQVGGAGRSEGQADGAGWEGRRRQLERTADGGGGGGCAEKPRQRLRQLGSFTCNRNPCRGSRPHPHPPAPSTDCCCSPSSCTHSPEVAQIS